MGGKLKDGIVVGTAVPFEIRDKLDKIAKKKGKNRSEVIRNALNEYIGRSEWWGVI